MLKLKGQITAKLPTAHVHSRIKEINDLLKHYKISNYDDIDSRSTLLGKELGLLKNESQQTSKVISKLFSFQKKHGVALLPISPKDYLRDKIMKEDNFRTSYVSVKCFGKEIARKNLLIMVEAYLEKYQIFNLDQFRKEDFKLAYALGLPREDCRTAKPIAIGLFALCHDVFTYPLPPILPVDYCPISKHGKGHPSLYFDHEVVGHFADTNRELALVKYLLANRINFISDLNKKHSALGTFLGLAVEDRRNTAKLALALKEKFTAVANRLESK